MMHCGSQNPSLSVLCKGEASKQKKLQVPYSHIFSLFIIRAPAAFKMHKSNKSRCINIYKFLFCLI